jgi:hypothetical protein
MSRVVAWTSAADLRAQVRRLWDQGKLLAELTVLAELAGQGDGEGDEPLFPRRLRLKGPTSAELSERFDDVRDWVRELLAAPHIRVVSKEVRHRVRGTNHLPHQVWVESVDDALAIIGATAQAERFAGIVELTKARRPALVPWLARRPLGGLEHADEWHRLLDLVDWLEHHPAPDVYLRQIDVPGVHSKYVEANRRILTELFDAAVPAAVVDPAATGVAGFNARYGFRSEPVPIRFRVLDPTVGVFDGKVLAGTVESAARPPDITVDSETFGRLRLGIRRVFITENKVNFLAFPPTPGSIVVFGAGFGFERFEGAPWLGDAEIYYWGDIDTHGFAILDQLRRHLPHTRSFLMDRPTLLAFEHLWETEPRPETRPLDRLTSAEAGLYDELRADLLGVNVRLEQERVAYPWLLAARAELLGEEARRQPGGVEGS